MFSIFKKTKMEQIKVINKSDFSDAISDANVPLVDVRTANEYKAGKIAHAQNIDVLSQDFVDQIKKLDKDKTTYIYCRSGNRSQKAAQIMVDLGFKEVIDLKGGYMTW